MNKLINPMNLNTLQDNANLQVLDIVPICGIYFMVDGGTIVYVGQSNDIYMRISQHKDKKYEYVLYLEYPENELNDRENEYIVGFNPKYNKTHKAMIALNKYRLYHSALTKPQISCICNIPAEEACRFLGIDYGMGIQTRG